MPADVVSRPLERAQLVWQRARQLTGPRAFHDRFDNALDLLRTAQHDPSTMVHALTLGQSQLERDSGDSVTRAAAEILGAAIEFLGVKPRTGDLAATHRRRPARRRKSA